MKSAYYSRNNSYSRSYNAEFAENENRYPLTRAAKYLGLSTAAFKAGLNHSGISASEWHHVGKYANQVDYYDVSKDSEIILSSAFWFGAKNKSNKDLCEKYYRKALKSEALSNLKHKFERWSKNERKPKFAKKLQESLNNNDLRDLILYLGDQSCIKGTAATQYVTYGSGIEDELRVCFNGMPYSTGRKSMVSYGKRILPFDLSPKNIIKIKKEISKRRHEAFKSKMAKMQTVSIINRENVKRILDRYIRGVFQNNTLQFCSLKDFIIAAKIIERHVPGASYQIIDNKYCQITMPEKVC